VTGSGFVTDVRQLHLGEQLGSGGQGRIVAVDNSIHDGCPTVFKRYASIVADQIDAAALEEIVKLPLSLDQHERDWLHEKFAWPLMLVEDRGAVCGFLMCRVAQPYYFNFQTQSQGALSRLADIAFLLNDDKYVSRAGLLVSERDRLELLSSLAEVLSRMHQLGIVMGDLSPKNILFRQQPSPSCFIIDCDSSVVRGSTVLPQVDTPDWEVPRGEVRATISTDSYKFGLLAIRLFARDQSSVDVSALAQISSDLGVLAAASLNQDPFSRPIPGAWMDALGNAIAGASASPAIYTVDSASNSAEAEVSRAILRDELDVGWQMRHVLGPARAVRSSARSPVISL
jgi:serine/threonine protein kinase